MTEYIEQTQKELGAIISSPKLTEKLLSRPPFRFLHDVVMNFQQTTGFPKGLYSADMEDSNKVSDKESKLQFLDHLIAAVEAATGKSCPAKSAKIVAGQEPESTNALLQMLASCAALSDDKKLAAVQKAKGGSSSAAPTAAPAKERSKSTTDESKEKSKDKERSKDEEKAKEKAKDSDKEKPQEKERSKDKAKEKPQDAEPEARKAKDKTAETEEERRKRHEEERRKRHEERKREKEKEEENTKSSSKDDKEEERRRRHEEKKREREEERRKSSGVTSEPATAGKAPPRTKPTHEVIVASSGVDAAPVAGVIREAKQSNDDEDGDATVEDWQKVAEQYDSKQGKGKRKTSVGDDAEVKGALGQQALKAKRDAEEAARQGKDDAATRAVQPPKDGGIVIRNRKGTAAEGSGAMGDNELSKLREQLQLLTKASNPLGKFLEAIHDDIDSMLRELEMWRSEARSQALAATEARHQTEESLQEVHVQLQSMEDAINDQVLKTNLLRQKIITNDKAIHAMMRTIVNPEVASR